MAKSAKELVKEYLKNLKEAHNKAVEDSAETFEFGMDTLDTGYAKYLIEYIEEEYKTMRYE